GAVESYASPPDPPSDPFGNTQDVPESVGADADRDQHGDIADLARPAALENHAVEIQVLPCSRHCARSDRPEYFSGNQCSSAGTRNCKTPPRTRTQRPSQPRVWRSADVPSTRLSSSRRSPPSAHCRSSCVSAPPTAVFRQSP